MTHPFISTFLFSFYKMNETTLFRMPYFMVCTVFNSRLLQESQTVQEEGSSTGAMRSSYGSLDGIQMPSSRARLAVNPH